MKKEDNVMEKVYAFMLGGDVGNEAKAKIKVSMSPSHQ